MTMEASSSQQFSVDSSSGADSSAESSSDSNEQASSEDYLKALRHLGGEVESLKTEKESTSKAVRQANETIERIGRAIAGNQEEGKPSDPDAEFLNLFLDEALKDQKAGGQGLPLTTKLAMSVTELRKEIREMRDLNAKLIAGQQALNDPENQYDRSAYAEMDMQIQNSLKSVYGEVNPRLFQAITAEVGGEIQRLKKEKPQVWGEIRRNPDYMRRMSLHFVEKFVPPKARQIMLDEREKNTPMTRAELNQAMREADQIQDPAARAKIKEAVRHKILEEMVAKR